jgi:8-oxo-dGTP pyrophosphatase MutT (NUDIX family)
MSRHEALLEQLHRYQPVDELEAQHHRALVNLLTMPDDTFVRDHFAPGHVTASLFILDPSSSALLLHHHRRLDRWLQMGGHVEAGEQPADAALREGAEESGLADLELLPGIFDLDVHAIPAGKGEPDHLHFDVRYLARTASPEGITIDPQESNDLAWVPLADAVPLMNEEASSRVVRKIERFLRDSNLQEQRSTP